MDYLHVHFRDQWYRCGSTFTRGYAYVGEKLLSREALAQFFADTPPSGIGSALRGANGFFAVVRTTDRGLLAAVDRIRSVPLFYAIDGDHVYVSDDAYWVAEQMPSDQYDELSIAEFLLTGYVTGQDTLHPDVKQLRASELLSAEKTSEGLRMKLERYYRYLHHDYLEEPEESLMEEWDAILVRTFERLIRSVNDRSIVIPLSGGYDSRLIAIMLKRLGYGNVICFSYGKPGNWESKVSEQVARGLGYRWEFIPYSHRLWYEWFHSEERKAYVRYGDGLTSVTHIQDWPAVWDMKKKGVIPEDSVFVPGHTGDFISGGHIPAKFCEAKRIGAEMVVHAIKRKHYSLQDLRGLYSLRHWQMPMYVLCSRLTGRILNSIGDMPCETPQDAASVFEYWEWQERQVKLIGNSVRVYDFWGYDWQMPFWDAEVMAFWARVPLRHKLRKKLYDTYVEQVQGDIDVQPPGQYSTKQYLRRFLSAVDLYEPLYEHTRKLRPTIKRLSYRREYYHPLCWYGIMSMKQFRNLYSGREYINSFLASERLGLVSF